ncbi:MAG TPA: hypothetical protein VGB65_13130 [Allosphingosinicella sp.]
MPRHTSGEFLSRPLSISRLIASVFDGLGSGCRAIHASTAASCSA